MSDHNDHMQGGALPSVPLQPVVRPLYESTGPQPTGSDAERDEMEEYAAVRGCMGNCVETHGSHAGPVEVVRVIAPDGYDWGWWPYCQNAIDEDTKRGMRITRSNPTLHPHATEGSV